MPDSQPASVKHSVDFGTAAQGLLTYVQAMSKFGVALARMLELSGPVRHSSPPAGARKRMAAGQCYHNAGALHLQHPQWTYCEGFACPVDVGIPVSHAWLLDEEGLVVDATWKPGAVYLGLPFTASYCMQTWEDTGYWGLWAEHVPFEVFRKPVWDVLRRELLLEQATAIEEIWKDLGRLAGPATEPLREAGRGTKGKGLRQKTLSPQRAARDVL
jgi:hypothetical protein